MTTLLAKPAKTGRQIFKLRNHLVMSLSPSLRLLSRYVGYIQIALLNLEYSLFIVAY